MTTTILMTVDQWVAVKENPRQRGTEERAERAIKYLATPLQSHFEVSAGRLPSGEMYKLDGHTRALLWLTNKIPCPKSVRVTMYDCRDIGEVKHLYDSFDNKKAVKTPADDVQGAFRESGWFPESSYLRAGRISSALSIAERCARRTTGNGAMPVAESLPNWLFELKIVDEILPGDSHKLHAGMLAAMLVTLRKRGNRAKEFWVRYFDRNTIVMENQPIAVFRRLFLQMKAAKVTGNTSARNEIAAKAVSCVEAHLAGKVYSGGVKSTDLTSYL